jgi:DNA-binding CsgD family transcriptional regulator/PAS domain-containing protein
MDATGTELVAAFYEANVDPTAWPRALQRLAAALDADACGLVHRDFAAREARFLQTHGLGQPALDEYALRSGRNDVWLADEKRCRTGAVFAGSEIISTALLSETPFHREWLAGIDVADALFCVLLSHERTAVFCALYRRSGRPPFGADEIANLQAIAARLASAYRLGYEVRRQQAERQAAIEALDVAPIGVVTVDRTGTIIRANRYAQAVLASGEGLARSEGGLVLERPGQRIRLRDVLAQTNKNRTNAGFPEVVLYTIPRFRRQRPLTCLIAPVASGDAARTDGPAALVFVSDPERTVAFEPMRIARLYGLSRAEARVAALLARGLRLEEIGEHLGIAYETVRKHLKQIFTKTGVSRQAELVRVLVTGPAGLAVGIGFASRGSGA